MRRHRARTRLIRCDLIAVGNEVARPGLIDGGASLLLLLGVSRDGPGRYADRPDVRRSPEQSIPRSVSPPLRYGAPRYDRACSTGSPPRRAPARTQPR